jgi:alpha-glucosidase
MFDAMRFWLKRGVDGFRVDVVWLMSKDEQFRDNPPNPSYHLGQASSLRLLPLYNSNRPEVHELVAEMRGVVDEFADRALIGEIYLPIHQVMSNYGTHPNGANLPFNFQLLQCPWNAESLKRVISDYYGALPKGAWPNWVLGNHDNARIASRVGSAQATVAAMLLMTLPGTLTLYYGEELGMTNVPIAPDQVRDPVEKNEPGIGHGRDPERSPMQWDGSPNAGFTSGCPWLPIGKDHDVINVAALEQEPTSILTLYHKLIELRRRRSTLISGSIQSISAEGPLLRYQRIGSEDRLLVALNVGNEPVRTETSAGVILASTSFHQIGQRVPGSFDLRPAEGILIELDK